MADYNNAFTSVHGSSKGVLPASALGVTGAVSLRAASAEKEQVEPGEVQRARETSDVLWNLNKYRTITCDCGTKLRVPPSFKGNSVRCPHCGRINSVAK